MKNTMRYIFLVITILALIGVSIYSYIYLHYNDKGTINVDNNYYDIMFTNVNIGNDNLLVKVNDEKDSIHIEIPNIIKNNVYSFSIDVKNIGNQSISIKDILYNNINTNVEESNVLVESNFSENDVINGGEVRKLDIRVKYIGDVIENSFYNFDINYHFMK